MKYLTLEYDMNSPVDKAVSVPLDSDYGLAVKVYKDGQPVQSAISVDGAAPTGTRADWRLFGLSSGSEPRQRLVEVQAAEISGSHYGHTWTEHVENETDQQQDFNTLFPFSDLSAGDTLRLEASKTQLQAWLAGEQSLIDSLYVIKDFGEQNESLWTLDEERGKWEDVAAGVESDYIDVAPTDKIQTLYALDARQSAELRVVIEVDKREEGEPVGFKLIVKEKDMGRMEVKEQA